LTVDGGLGVSALKRCDIAVSCAAQLRKKASKETDFLFDLAIRDLKDYDRDYHPGTDVEGILEGARQNDVRRMHQWRNQAGDHTLSLVEFHILSTLPSENPTVVKQWLDSSPGRSLLPEILWNFSHFKGQQRLTLSQNPHFYRYLPTSPAAYGATFESIPTENYEGRIYVLTNSSGRVFFEFDGKSRAFDIIRAMNNTLVFKDTGGRLRHESALGKSIRDRPPFWYRKKPTPAQIEPEAAGRIKDWGELIEKLGEVPYAHIRIGAPERNVKYVK